jgi:hypothetical protein
MNMMNHSTLDGTSKRRKATFDHWKSRPESYSEGKIVLF